MSKSFPKIEVLGLGEDWTDQRFHHIDDPDEFAAAVRAIRTWERYGVVEVRVGAVTYDVGCAIGVQEYQRGSAAASGNYASGPFLTAWYADSTDWELAPASDGTTGIPMYLRDAIEEAIQIEASRLWSEIPQT